MPVTGDVEIRILEKDAKSFNTDVLVLKHAQALHGLDAQIVEVAHIEPADLPLPDGFRVIRSPTGIAADGLMFVGVPPMREFSYSHIRRFGYKALCSIASAFPGAAEIALTLHGVGYGLDEFECFDAEVAGIVDALDTHDYPRSLRTISILEINPGRADRLTRRLEALIGQAFVVTPEDPRDNVAHRSRSDRLRRAGTVQDQPDHAFVAMPFDPGFSDLFHYGISNAVRRNGLLCERIDQQAFTGDILQRLRDQIESAKFLIADLTTSNANVYLEIGFAWGNRIPTVLICRKGNGPSLTCRVTRPCSTRTFAI